MIEARVTWMSRPALLRHSLRSIEYWLVLLIESHLQNMVKSFDLSSYGQSVPKVGLKQSLPNYSLFGQKFQFCPKSPNLGQKVDLSKRKCKVGCWWGAGTNSQIVYIALALRSKSNINANKISKQKQWEKTQKKQYSICGIVLFIAVIPTLHSLNVLLHVSCD